MAGGEVIGVALVISSEGILGIIQCRLGWLWQSELPLDVEEDVGLALADRLGVGGEHGGVVEVEPVAVLRHERRVVTGASPAGEERGGDDESQICTG